jgi:hypothetical protein
VGARTRAEVHEDADLLELELPAELWAALGT